MGMTAWKFSSTKSKTSCWAGGVGMGLHPAPGGIFGVDGWGTHSLSLPTWMDKYDLDPEIFLYFFCLVENSLNSVFLLSFDLSFLFSSCSRGGIIFPGIPFNPRQDPGRQQPKSNVIRSKATQRTNSVWENTVLAMWIERLISSTRV